MIRHAEEVYYLANYSNLELAALVPPISAWLSVQDAIPGTLHVEAEVAPFMLGVALVSQGYLYVSQVGMGHLLFLH